jgi:hypothetical protein
LGRAIVDWEPGSTYSIRYIAASGENTTRLIDLLEVRARGSTLYLRAFCHLRNEERTFRADRVTSAQYFVPTKLMDSILARPERSVEPYVFPAAQTAPARAPVSVSKPVQQVCLPHPTRESLGRHIFSKVKAFFGTIFVILILAALMDKCGLLPSRTPSWQPNPSVPMTIVVPPPPPDPVQRLPSPAVAPAVRVAPAVPALPADPPGSTVDVVTLGGEILRTVHSGDVDYYEVPSTGFVTTDKRQAVAAIRVPRFEAVTGIRDPELIERYLDADLDGSGKLSWEELRAFQVRTYEEFRYVADDGAERPDQFLHSHEGNCVDFSRYTAGLLRFWGWQPYIGCLRPPRDGVGHAICLSCEEGEISDSFTYYRLDEGVTDDGTFLAAGKYVPIDYEDVGALTNASGPDWKLAHIYTPESTYGKHI